MVRKHITTSVPIAGKVLYGLGSWSAYEMARRGEINVIQVGRHKRVPVVWMEQMSGVGAGELDHLIDKNDQESEGW